MAELPNRHPHVYNEFMSGGKFTVQKTTDAFSSIPLDHAYEQNGELIKNAGWVIRITENPNALLRWMVSGAELAKMVKDFEYAENKNDSDNPYHTMTFNFFFLQPKSLATHLRKKAHA